MDDLATTSSASTAGTLRLLAVCLLILAMTLLVLSLQPELAAFIAVLDVVLILVTFAWLPRYRKYARVLLLLVLPAVLAFAVVASLASAWLNSDLARPMYEYNLMQEFADSPSNRTGLAMLLGLAAAALVPWLILRTYVLYNEDVVMTVTGLDRNQTQQLLRALFLNTARPFSTVEDGKVKTSRPAGVWSQMGGPGLLIVRPGNAAVLERGGKFTRIVTNGIHTTKRFERVMKVIDLQFQDNVTDPVEKGALGKQWVRNIVTRDRILIDVEMQVFYGIRRIADPKDPYKVHQRDVYLAAFEFGNWQNAIPFIAADYLRNVIGRMTLDELFLVSHHLPVLRGNIARSIQDDLNLTSTRNWGIEVSGVAIGEVRLPEDVWQKLKAEWLSDKDIQIRKKESLAEAEVLKTVEAARTEAHGDMVATLARQLRNESIPLVERSREYILWLRYLETLREIATKPSTRILFPYGFPFGELRNIQDLIGATTIDDRPSGGSDGNAREGASAQPDSRQD